MPSGRHVTLDAFRICSKSCSVARTSARFFEQELSKWFLKLVLFFFMRTCERHEQGSPDPPKIYSTNSLRIKQKSTKIYAGKMAARSAENIF